MTPPVHDQWVNPYIKTKGFHGYWAYDFTAVDPHFGTLADYKELVSKAHGLGLKVIQDIVARLQTDADATPAARETRAFEVGTPADVQRLLPLVQQLYAEHWKSKEVSDPADAQMISDARNGRLIVTASEAHLLRIEELVRQSNVAEAGGNALAHQQCEQNLGIAR